MSKVNEFIEKYFCDTVKNKTEDEGRLIGLPYPYTTPCANEMFVEFFYWDTYFTNVGLIAEGDVEQAKNNTDNVGYIINKYGYMLNANTTNMLGNQQSQPPYYFKMVEEVFDVTGDKEWLKESYKTLAKEYEFWQTERIAPNGLNIYGPHKGYSADKIERFSKYFLNRFKGYELKNEEDKVNAAHTIFTMCESGWDCNSRFENAGEFYNPVDLNSLLYGLEKAMAKFAKVLENGEEALWNERAAQRKAKMLELMYDKESGVLLDYNYKEQKLSPVVSFASIYPLFVGMLDSAEKEMELLRDKLMLKYGVSPCVPGEYNYALQWDYPNIWPPLQYIAYIACKNYGYDDLAKKVAETYIKLIDENFAKTGNLWEKYNGLNGTVANEDYNAPKMMGWTAGMYMYFSRLK